MFFGKLFLRPTSRELLAAFLDGEILRCDDFLHDPQGLSTESTREKRKQLALGLCVLQSTDPIVLELDLILYTQGDGPIQLNSVEGIRLELDRMKWKFVLPTLVASRDLLRSVLDIELSGDELKTKQILPQDMLRNTAKVLTEPNRMAKIREAINVLGETGLTIEVDLRLRITTSEDISTIDIMLIL